MQRITPFLWFNGNAAEAARFYVSVFKHRDSKLHGVSPMGARLRLLGQELIAHNGGPEFPFTPAISLFVSCKDQREVDTLWVKLSKGGKKGRCGWLTDRFGLSWQVIPEGFGALMGGGGDPARAKRVFAAMMKMTKIDLAKLQRAYDAA